MGMEEGKKKWGLQQISPLISGANAGQKREFFFAFTMFGKYRFLRGGGGRDYVDLRFSSVFFCFLLLYGGG